MALPKKKSGAITVTHSRKKCYDEVSAQIGLSYAEEETGQGDIDSGKSR